MGRLLEALRADSENAATAKPANPANPCPKISKLAALAGPPISQSERLLRIIRNYGLPDSLLSAHDGTDEDLASLNGGQLSAYVLMLSESADREDGRCPRDETAPALCRHCGPIWIAPEVAAMAPIVDGWARVLGCPWCHVKNRKPLPRPAVTCSACNHFQRDKINPRDGIGSCSMGCDHERPLFPNASRKCQSFQPTGGTYEK